MLKKQTAVEWLEEIYLTAGIDRNVHFNQAKIMHKEEMEDTYLDGYTQGYNRAVELIELAVKQIKTKI